MTTASNSDLSLEAQIAAFVQERSANAPANPAAVSARAQQLEMLIQTQAAEKSLHEGQQAPDFSLPNVDGTIVRLKDLL